MLFPVLPAVGPIWVIYYVHDALILPIKGRVFERYAPVPQLVILTLVLFSLFAVLARRHAEKLYAAALRLLLRFDLAKAGLEKWIAWRPQDAYLRSALEAVFREASDTAFQDRTPKHLSEATVLGETLLKLKWPVSARLSIAKTGLAARLAVLTLLQAKPRNRESLVGIVSQLPADAPLATHFRTILGQKTANGDWYAPLDSAWRVAASYASPEDDLARDATQWMAVVVSLLDNDASAQRLIQRRMASLAFERDLNGLSTPALGITFDPMVWVLDPGLSEGDAVPGMALAGDAVKKLGKVVEENGIP